MNPIAKLLASGQNKQKTQHITQAIITGEYSIEDLMDCFFSNDWRLCQYASWPLAKLSDHNPEVIIPYLGRMLEHLDNPVHDAVIRNTMRCLQFIDVPEEYIGPVYDRAFEYFADPKFPIGIRVFAMTTCCNIAMKYPELAEEIKPLILEYWDHASAAWRSRGKKEIKRLDRITGNL